MCDRLAILSFSRELTCITYVACGFFDVCSFGISVHIYMRESSAAGCGRPRGRNGDVPMRPRQVLITGGAGFLGAHLVECFRREEIPVRLLDQTERPHW